MAVIELDQKNTITPEVTKQRIEGNLLVINIIKVEGSFLTMELIKTYNSFEEDFTIKNYLEHLIPRYLEEVEGLMEAN